MAKISSAALARLQACVLSIEIVAGTACSGQILDRPRIGDGAGGPGKLGPAAVIAAAGSGGASAAGLPAATACIPGAPAPQTRLARLTHLQYSNTIRDLTGLDMAVAADFLADPHQAGFNRGLDLQVGDVLAKSYRDAAEGVAAAVVADSTAYARVLGCAPAQGDACATSFIAGFGKRALRRPLTAAEQAAYLTLFKSGASLVDTGDEFQRGVQVTLEAMLQSPKFLYRVELTPASVAQTPLDHYEVATRLSYLLVNGPPDAALMAAADAGQLGTADAVVAQARRLLTGDRAHDTVRDFHHQWLDLDAFPNKLAKDQTLYPGITPELAPVLQSEVEHFVDAVSFERKRGFGSLFTASFSFVNRATAAIYGVTGSFGDALQQTALDPSQRAGLLTQVGFLATRAFSNASSPIHRGVFVQRRLLCNAIPDPPPNVPALPPLDGTVIKTTREQVDQHTAPTACAGCHHTLINPVGFGLENYDAVGRFRTTENGNPIDAMGDLAGTAAQTNFSNGVELAHAVADAPEARACYAKNWFRYVQGRAETDADSCVLAQTAARLADDNYTSLDLLADLTGTPAFRTRAQETP